MCILPNGMVRSYSLLNDSSERHRYVLGVLKDAKSRGGSKAVHETIACWHAHRDFVTPQQLCLARKRHAFGVGGWRHWRDTDFVHGTPFEKFGQIV